MDNPELSTELNPIPAKSGSAVSNPEPQPQVDRPGPPADPLLALAVAARAARLAPADEERATALLKERLAGSRAEMISAVEPMVGGLPWIVCVNAVSAAWESWSPPTRRLLLASVAKSETEAARRLQLSLARAVFKLDPAAGLKLAAAAAASLKTPETGALNSKHRQIFFNVLIGKGKPWLSQLPLKELKAADADALVHAAIECFPICPPFSQLSILRWAHEAGRLGKKADAADLETAAKSVARWNLKFQRQLKAEIANLPPVIAGALKPEASQPEEKPVPPPRETAGAEVIPAPEAKAQPKAPATGDQAAEKAPVTPESRERPEPRKDGGKSKKQPQQQPRQPEPPHGREPQKEHLKETHKEAHKEQPQPPQRGPKAPFDFKEAMRGVESYVATLRNELEQTKAQLRRKEEKRPRRELEEHLPAAEAEALTRHNARLEAAIAELRQQLEDLRGHHEAVAESFLMRTGQPREEGSADQLRSLLSIQLSEPCETYLAMRQEALDKVFRLDYRDLLGKVFDILREAGVALPPPPQKP